MKPCVHVWQYLTEFGLEWEMFVTKDLEKLKTRSLFSTPPHPPFPPFLKSYGLWDNAKKIWYSQTGHSVKYNTVHAHCVLDNEDNRQTRTHTRAHTNTHAHAHTHTHARTRKHAHRICSTYCFSTAAVFMLTCMNVTLYVYMYYARLVRSQGHILD